MENDEETLLLIQGINRQSSEELEDCMYDVVPLLATKLESNNSDIIRSSMLVLEKMARRCNSAKEMTLYINGAIIKDKNGPKYYQTYYLAHLFVNILSFRLTTGSQMIALGFIPNLIRRILRPFKGWYTNIKAFNDQGDNDDSTDEYQDEKEQKEVEIKEKKQYLNEDSESELGETSEEDLSECSDLSEDEQQQQQKEKDQQQMKVDDESEDTFDINSFTSFYFENQWRKSQSIRDGIPIVRSSIKGVSPLFDVTLEVIAKSLGSNIKDIVSSLINTGIQPIFTPIPNISAEKENDLRLKCKTALWYMMLHLLRSMTLSMREVELRETGWRLLKMENIGTSSSSSQASSKSPSFINSVFYNRSDELKEILNDLQRNDLKEEINDFQKDIKTINSKYKLKKPSKNEIEKQEQDKLHKVLFLILILLERCGNISFIKDLCMGQTHWNRKLLLYSNIDQSDNIQSSTQKKQQANNNSNENILMSKFCFDWQQMQIQTASSSNTLSLIKPFSNAKYLHTYICRASFWFFYITQNFGVELIPAPISTKSRFIQAIAAAMELLISKSVILSSRAIILVQAATKKFIQEGFDPIHFSFSRNARGCAQSLLDHQTNHPFFTLLYSHQLQNLDICEQTPIYASAEVIIKDRKKQRQNFASNNEQKSDGQISSVNIWNKEVDRIFEILGLHSELVQVSSCFLKYATNLISYESQHPFIDTALSFVSLLPQSQLASRNQILLINSLLLSLIPALNVSSQAASLNAALTGGKTKKEVVADQRLNSLIPDILTKFKSFLFPYYMYAENVSRFPLKWEQMFNTLFIIIFVASEAPAENVDIISVALNILFILLASDERHRKTVQNEKQTKIIANEREWNIAEVVCECLRIEMSYLWDVTHMLDDKKKADKEVEDANKWIENYEKKKEETILKQNETQQKEEKITTDNSGTKDIMKMLAQYDPTRDDRDRIKLLSVQFSYITQIFSRSPYLKIKQN